MKCTVEDFLWIFLSQFFHLLFVAILVDVFFSSFNACFVILGTETQQFWKWIQTHTKWNAKLHTKIVRNSMTVDFPIHFVWKSYDLYVDYIAATELSTFSCVCAHTSVSSSTLHTNRTTFKQRYYTISIRGFTHGASRCGDTYQFL